MLLGVFYCFANIFNKKAQKFFKLCIDCVKKFDEDGILLSGGELQKLAIARLLYKNSSVFVLDEPSSSLDPISEKKINDLVASITKDKILFIISHRLTTTKDADIILYLENGCLLEIGTHDKLVELGGKYNELYQAQASNYDKKSSDFS